MSIEHIQLLDHLEAAENLFEALDLDDQSDRVHQLRVELHRELVIAPRPTEICNTCDGTGQREGLECDVCFGTGKIPVVDEQGRNQKG